jgi:hypothetical protein
VSLRTFPITTTITTTFLLLLSCSLWGKPAQLGLFSDLCTFSPDIAPECCLRHDLSFSGGTAREFMIANHEFALCLYSNNVSPLYTETAFKVVSSKKGWSHFNERDIPARRLPLNYPHTCKGWQW